MIIEKKCWKVGRVVALKANADPAHFLCGNFYVKIFMKRFLCKDFYVKIFAIQVLNSFKDNILQDFISFHQPDLLLLVMRKLIFVSDNISQNFYSSDSAAAKAMLPKAGH